MRTLPIQRTQGAAKTFGIRGYAEHVIDRAKVPLAAGSGQSLTWRQIGVEAERRSARLASDDIRLGGVSIWSRFTGAIFFDDGNPIGGRHLWSRAPTLCGAASRFPRASLAGGYARLALGDARF
jgi:hypothetical protein